MIQSEGFVDLRPQSGNSMTEESVWPSFTDIMTVIVMIFLMALVVILVRNADLVRQLSQTIILEQELAAQSDTLELRTATLADEISILQLRLGETDAIRVQAESTVVEQQQKISTLLSNITALDTIRENLQKEQVGLASSRDVLQVELASMEQKQRVLEDLKNSLTDEVSVLALERETLTEEKTILTKKNSLLSEQYRNATVILTEKTLTLEQKLAELLSLKTILEQRITSLEKEKLEFDSEHATLTEKNEGLNRKLSALTQFQVKLADQVNELTLTIFELKQDKDRLLQENRSTTSVIATLLELRQLLEREKEILKISLAESEKGLENFKLSRYALEEEVSELVQSRLTLEQEKAGLVEQMSEAEKERGEKEKDLRSEIRTIIAEKSRLEKEKTELDQKVATLTKEQKDSAQVQANLSKELEGSGERYRLTKKEIDYLVSKHAEEISEFEDEKALLIESLETFNLLTSQYGDLEIAYNRLVRPARNMVGRYVVEIRYWKKNGRFYYSIKEPEQVVEMEISEVALHERLRKLKEANPGKLFTHVIFPGGKNISHEEAWLFERDVVSRYDYYHSD